jgi:hypothetical protein
MLSMDSHERLGQKSVIVVPASDCYIQPATTLRLLTLGRYVSHPIFCRSKPHSDSRIPANRFLTAADDRGARNRVRNRDVLSGTRR